MGIRAPFLYGPSRNLYEYEYDSALSRTMQRTFSCYIQYGMACLTSSNQPTNPLTNKQKAEKQMSK